MGFSLVTTQPIDTSTSIRKLLLEVLAAVAEFEKALIIERTKEGLARTKKRPGQEVGKGNRPLGFSCGHGNSRST